MDDQLPQEKFWSQLGKIISYYKNHLFDPGPTILCWFTSKIFKTHFSYFYLWSQPDSGERQWLEEILVIFWSQLVTRSRAVWCPKDSLKRETFTKVLELLYWPGIPFSQLLQLDLLLLPKHPTFYSILRYFYAPYLWQEPLCPLKIKGNLKGQSNLSMVHSSCRGRTFLVPLVFT